ncbi:MAG: metal ABC transporter ATP-binding protein [Intrasporangium sp.]|uniref:metal ABC transporter ATP-binding protein n=1 Tax=Intrasporangium sp. TaxID=1925024 RepID=UPI00264966AE|nr:metal ABC transporter ATP-binding protein [Intrasporangium sp.]MDN5796564.1 metal ABC transporter ATP-binding protein [Intrasporangium sp.]
MSAAPRSASRADPSPVPVIELRGAAFGYGEHAVVTDVTLPVHRGEIVAVLGPNGSGKSTLMKGILGLNEHLAGTVRLFGEPADELRDRARVGYVPQRHTLSSSIRSTAEEIVATGRLPRLGWLGRPKATDRQVVARALELVGLSDRAATEVATLSGGQQRRVLIARALAGQPDVLVMDEPTAGVDVASQHVLADVLARLVARGVTMLIVTHELGALERLLTRIVVVDGGRVTFDGPPRRFAARRRARDHAHDTHRHDSELAAGDTAAVVPHGPADRSGQAHA